MTLKALNFLEKRILMHLKILKFSLLMLAIKILN